MWVLPQLCRCADAGACRRRRWRCSPPRLIKTLLLYPHKVRSGVRGAPSASVAGLSLDPYGGQGGVERDCSPRGKPFLRTPKCADPADFSQVLRVVWQETALLALLLVAMVSMGFDRGFQDPAVTLWMVMLGVQSLPYLATMVTARISARSNRTLAAPCRPRPPSCPRRRSFPAFPELTMAGLDPAIQANDRCLLLWMGGSRPPMVRK